MGSGGSGASSGGNSSSSGGWGSTMGNGSAYGPGGLGGLGTAGTMSAGAGGSAMSGFGNTGAGGSGKAGISNSSSGYTSPGFTPAYGDPRGLTVPGAPGYQGSVYHDAQGNNYMRQTSYIKGEPHYTYTPIKGVPMPTVYSTANFKKGQTPPGFSSTIPTQTNALRFRMSPTETRVFGDPYNGTGPLPGFPNPNRPGGYNNPSPGGTIGNQVGSSSTFGPGTYGNGGLMSGNPAGGGLSTGLGSRTAAVGYGGGVNRSMGNIIGR